MTVAIDKKWEQQVTIAKDKKADLLHLHHPRLTHATIVDDMAIFPEIAQEKPM